MKFVDVTNHFAFLKLFCNEKKSNILISFLNAVLDLEEELVKIKYINWLNVLRVLGENASIIDVEGIDKKGRQLVVELQFTSKGGFGRRIKYYTCPDYKTEVDNLQIDAPIKPNYFIGLLDFTFFDSPQYLSHHIIVNGKTYEQSDIQFAFIELEKFHLTEKEPNTLIEKWVYFIKNARNLKVIPKHVNDDGLLEAYQNADKHNWNKEELRAYDNASIARQDERGKLEAAKKEGYMKGKRDMKFLHEIIIKCWKEKIEVETIAFIVNLPLKEVQEVIEKHNK